MEDQRKISLVTMQVMILTCLSLLLLFYYATRKEVDFDAVVESKVDERLAQLQAELAVKLDLREEEHDKALHEEWARWVKEAEARVEAELRQRLEENERRHQEQEEKEREEIEQLRADVQKLKEAKGEEKAETEGGKVELTPQGVPHLQSLPRVRPVPNERLDAVLKARATSFDLSPSVKRQDVVLVVFNRGYVEMLANLLCTLRKVNVTNVVGIALDEEALALCPGLGIDCALPGAAFLRASSADFHYHGNDDFKSLSKLKSRNVLEVLLRGYTVLLVDGDIVFFADPLPLLRNGSVGVDMQVQSDSPHGVPKNAYLNSGMYYLVANQRSIDFLIVLWEYGRTTAANASEQAAFSQLTHQMQLGQAPGLNMSRANLELHEFCNGNNYFSTPPEGANGVYAVRPDASDHCYLLHFNWIYGSNKLKTMKGNKFWFVADDGSSCLTHESLPQAG